MMDAGIVNAQGVKVIDISLQRHKRGVKVTVRITPEVEEFFKRWGGGVVEAPHHRLWKTLNDTDEKLALWSFETALQGEDMNYSLFHTGSGFYTEHGTVNLSFIRLVGAVEGREFICDTVMSRGELDKIANRLRKAAEHFYSEFIQPVHMNIFVGVRDLQRGEV